VPLARDGEQLGRVSKEWAYPKDNDLSFTRSIGRHNPLHVVTTTSDDSFEEACRYYTTKCGHKKSLDNTYAVSGISQGAVYLIRSFPADSGTPIPRMIFMHHSHTHTITVTMMRPAESNHTHIDVAVSVR
jgi:hypothetical protein